MSKIICLNNKCPYRSKRPLRTWKLRNGEKVYSCTKPVTILGPMFDPDGETLQVFGYTPIECKQVEKEKYNTKKESEDTE